MRDKANIKLSYLEGFGTGVARNLADAHENSAKEAVTDALKRSLRSFGNQFGNSLYDKSKAMVAQNNNAPSSVPNPMPNIPANVNFSQNQAMPQNQMPNQAIPNNQAMDDVQTLHNAGLGVIEQNGFLLVCGNNIFAKKI